MSDLPALFNLSDRVAVVTGGAGFLGTKFCRTLAQAGAKVVIADHDSKFASELADVLRKDGHEALVVATNVTDSTSTKELVAKTLDAYGRLDILVNNAALNPKFGPQHVGKHTTAFEDYPLEAWNNALSVDLTGAFLCAQAATGPMLVGGSGVIINVCSIYGLVGPDQRLYHKEGQPPQFKPVSYSVTKAGLLGFTKYLATYYAGKNIRVNALTPGGVFNQHDEEFVKAYSARTVLGRMAEKDEMNGALLFLASDASAYMTGANLVVDGGWTAW